LQRNICSSLNSTTAQVYTSEYNKKTVCLVRTLRPLLKHVLACNVNVFGRPGCCLVSVACRPGISCISFKLRQEASCVFMMHCHVLCSSGSRIPIEVGSGATTCPVARNLTFLLRWAPVLPRVPLAPDLTSLSRWAPVLPRISWLRAVPLQGESFGAATCPTTPNGLWTTEIKKGLVVLVTQLGSRIFNVRLRITEAPTRRAGKRCHHDLQTVQTVPTRL
jgi:hypothetical protein